METSTKTSEKIAVFDRNRSTKLEDIAEAVGHEVSESQVVYVPEDFQTKYLKGCSTLVFVGASKIDAGGPTRHVPFGSIEDVARSQGIKTIYRLYTNDSGKARKGTNYNIEKIDL